MTETAITIKPEQKSRNATIDILKGLGIILVVIGHSGCPQPLGDFISSFHMPLFLIASGVFFKESFLYNKKNYAIRKVKGIYLPFLKWSYIFLLLHNLFFAIGIINDSYGSSTGSCAKFFSFYDIAIRIPAIAFTMNGFDNYLLGAYWFLRSLFLGCLLLCFCSWLVDKVVKSKTASIAIVAVLFCLMGGG
jgi:fucose 4-O-acetylase-like acetyltransferase